MRKAQEIQLTEAQRVELKQLLHAGDAPARTQTRARILLLSDRSQGGDWQSAPKIAQAVLAHPNTVRNVRRRFLAEGLEAALTERPRPGAVSKLTGDLEVQLTTLACSDPPAGHARWTLRLLAHKLIELGVVTGVSHVSVRAWLKKTDSSLGA
jgi:putative transposase